MTADNDSEIKFGFAIPTETVVRGDGSRGVVISTVGNNEEYMDRATQGLADQLGGGQIRPLDEKTSPSFSFDSRKWKGCSWNPKGPKPPWASNPQNN